MKKLFLLLGALATLFTHSLATQDPSDRPLASPNIRIPDGTRLRLLVANSVFAKAAKVHDPVQLRVIDEVRVCNLVVIANKALAQATISENRLPRRALRAGNMRISFDTVTLVNNEHLPLRGSNRTLGSRSEAGEDMVGLAQATYGVAIPLFPLFLIGHGNAAVLRKGTVLEAFINGDGLTNLASLKASQPPPSPRKDGPASVTVYWVNDGHAAGGRFWCGNVKLGGLKAGQNMTIHLPAGKYWFRSYDKKRAVALTIEEGGEYFLRADSSDRGSLVEHFLSRVEHDVGEAETSETQAVQHDKLTGLASVSVVDLQAIPDKKKQ